MSRRHPAPTTVPHRPRSAGQALALVAVLCATLSPAACSVTLNPGPATASEAEASRAAGAPQLGEAREPVVITAGRDGEELQLSDGTIVVRPAPKPSSDEDDDGSAGEEVGSGAGGDTASGGGNGTGSAGSGGSGGSGGDGGSAADLSDPVQYAGVLEDEVNQRRQAGGLSALTHDDCAYQVALERAEALRGQGLEHAPLGPIFDRCPTSTVGENLARGGWSPAEAADGWMNSEGHRANILNASFTRGAIACIAESTEYGTQMTCAHVFLG